MSDDLISRKAVLDTIKRHECDTSRITTGVLDLPTAYDVDKVIEQVRQDCFAMGFDESQVGIVVDDIRAGINE